MASTNFIMKQMSWRGLLPILLCARDGNVKKRTSNIVSKNSVNVIIYITISHVIKRCFQHNSDYIKSIYIIANAKLV